jgi:hypothetical protein
MAGYCFEKLKTKPEADKAFSYIEHYSNPDGWTSNAGNRLTAFTEKGIRDYKKMTTDILNEVKNDQDTEVLKAFLEIL